MNFRAFGRRWSFWVLGAALLLALVLLSGMILLTRLLSQPGTGMLPTAEFAILPAPTSTPMPPPDAIASATPTPQSLIVGGIGVGMYVQITGTEGDGLRLRSGAGTTNPPRFLGREAEVFQVRDGPKDADGYTWWYLVTPYDESRSGWAAANFLAVVTEPTP